MEKEGSNSHPRFTISLMNNPWYITISHWVQTEVVKVNLPTHPVSNGSAWLRAVSQPGAHWMLWHTQTQRDSRTRPSAGCWSVAAQQVLPSAQSINALAVLSCLLKSLIFSAACSPFCPYYSLGKSNLATICLPKNQAKLHQILKSAPKVKQKDTRKEIWSQTSQWVSLKRITWAHLEALESNWNL